MLYKISRLIGRSIGC